MIFPIGLLDWINDVTIMVKKGRVFGLASYGLREINVFFGERKGNSQLYK